MRLKLGQFWTVRLSHLFLFQTIEVTRIVIFSFGRILQALTQSYPTQPVLKKPALRPKVSALKLGCRSGSSKKILCKLWAYVWIETNKYCSLTQAGRTLKRLAHSVKPWTSVGHLFHFECNGIVQEVSNFFIDLYWQCPLLQQGENEREGE